MLHKGFLLCASILLPLFVQASDDAAKPSSGCQQLQNKLKKQTSFPGSKAYIEGVSENWSEACVFQATCLFEPTSADDVSVALEILTHTDTKFAVRGGGHMPVPSAAGIKDGVLISMEKLNNMQLSADRKTAQIGPGLRWMTVYDWISQYGLGVAGGRYGPVGVPGLLLGGGINYFGSQRGWASNGVSNFQVVLANGTITNANAQVNPDLFWALKGGSSNFGIITRFDLKTFPVGSIYGGTTSYQPSSINQYLDAIAGYIQPGGGSEDVMSSINPSLQLNVSTGNYTINSISCRVGSDANPAAFADFAKLPIQSTDNSVRSSFSAFTNETSAAAYGDRSQRWLFASKAVKGTAKSVYLTNKNFFDTVASMPELKKVPGLSLGSTQQTITKAWLRAAKMSGGDAIDLDPQNGNILAYLIFAAWDNPTDDTLAHSFATKCISNLEKLAKAQNLDYPYVYLNDALGEQNQNGEVFKMYGGGKSLGRLREVAGRYDPSGVFQNLMSGGFKLGK